MRFHLLSVLYVLATGPLLAVTMTLSSNMTWGSLRVMHAWNSVPENWIHLSRPPAEITIDLHIALKPQHENALIDTLYEISTSGRPRYGKHLSKVQVAELVAPHADTLELVGFWLEYNGVPSSSVSMTHGGSWLTVIGVPVSQANRLFGASYQLYRHTVANTTVLRTISYGLPAELHAHVQTIVPTTYFGSPQVPRQTSRTCSDSGVEALVEEASGEPVTMLSRQDEPEPEPKNEPVTPATLRSMYKTMGYVPVVAGQNQLGVGTFFEQYPSLVDLRQFMKEFRSDVDDATYSYTLINGGAYNPKQPGKEANQNIQYASAIAYPTPVIYYNTGGTPFVDDPFIHWLNSLLVESKVPQTITTTFGADERDMPQVLAYRICYLFAQLGVRGVSVLVASGDDGVGLGNCKDRSGNVRFIPTFPASCPFVTSVGGTKKYEPEEAAELSGGGFSDYFPRETYQDDAVAGFLRNLGNKYEGLYNPKGRAFPDIAAQALSFEIVNNRQPVLWTGTSCAAPTVASIISLLNDYRIFKGKKPLGWLNPWLYSRAFAGLNDITLGSNPGCETEGFSASVGWDPVTGLGTPDFDRLEEIIDEDLNITE